MAEQNGNLAEELPEEPLPAGLQEGQPRPHIDHGRETDSYLARKGEEVGEPIEDWAGLTKIKAFEDELGLQIDDEVRNDLLAILKDNEVDPQQALQELKNSKYQDQLYQPVADLIDKIVEHYDQIEEDVNSLRSGVAGVVEGVESAEAVNDDEAYKSLLFNSLERSLKTEEVSDDTVKTSKVAKAAKAAKTIRATSENRPADRASAATKIKAIFDKLGQETKANYGLITYDTEDLQVRINWLVKEYGFDSTVFGNAVKNYLHFVDLEEKAKSYKAKPGDKELGGEMLE